MKDIFDLGVQRSWKGAILFYIAYFVLGLVLVGVLGQILGLVLGDFFTDDVAHDLGFRIGAFLAILMVIGLSWSMIQKKSLGKDGVAIAIAIVAVGLSALAGLLGGLLPLAYLSTRSKVGSQTSTEGSEEDIN